MVEVCVSKYAIQTPSNRGEVFGGTARDGDSGIRDPLVIKILYCYIMEIVANNLSPYRLGKYLTLFNNADAPSSVCVK